MTRLSAPALLLLLLPALPARAQSPVTTLAAGPLYSVPGASQGFCAIANTGEAPVPIVSYDLLDTDGTSLVSNSNCLEQLDPGRACFIATGGMSSSFSVSCRFVVGGPRKAQRGVRGRLELKNGDGGVLTATDLR